MATSTAIIGTRFRISEQLEIFEEVLSSYLDYVIDSHIRQGFPIVIPKDKEGFIIEGFEYRGASGVWEYENLTEQLPPLPRTFDRSVHYF